ncbi:phosphoenolpyruvate--protein phosphotransferase [Pendulispora albinea]|uniref:phosphoenolpyruvate--protein phosphotransferase n=1 Tax=Pendulispora albinea TaxID=2741071 RepID=A0ABZ2M0T9_9BACT
MPKVEPRSSKDPSLEQRLRWPESGSKLAELPLFAPLSGPVVPLDAVPDPVFSTRMMGDGIAIEPISDSVVAPCDGIVTHLHRAGHALTLTAENGAEILVHVGIDTVHLQGRGFTAHVQEGAHVQAGDLLITFDVDKVAREVPSLQTMILVANSDDYSVAWRNAGSVDAGKSRLMTVRRRDPKDTPLIRASGEVAAARGPAGAGASEKLAEAVIAHHGGLHARPAALVTAAARRNGCDITVSFGGRTANARSVVALMGLGTKEGDRVTVHARGSSAEAALTNVIQAIQTAVAGAEAAPAAPGTALPKAIDSAADLSGAALTGASASPGLAVGRVVRLDSVDVEPPAALHDLDGEFERLAAALTTVRAEVAAAIRDANARHARQEHDMFVAHQALLDDPEIVSAAERAVGKGVSAGVAYRKAVNAECAVLSRLGNPLLAERITDLRDLERRVLLAMSGHALPEPELFAESIVVADDLALSEFTRLDKKRIVGICTARGGATSHVAILARALGVPSLVAMGPTLFSVPHGKEVLLDATAGRLDPEPTAERLATARKAMADRAARHAEALAQVTLPAITRDGHRIEVAANIATQTDAADAVRQGADGVGLLRTEVLFLDREDPPSEAEQRAAYQGVIDALEGRAAIIRTLDAGGDKPLPFLPLPKEDNPALGLRGIRSGFAQPELLDTQLRALLGVTPIAACKIMLPMVSDAEELLFVRGRVDAIAKELKLTERPSLGVMIEVPSAALLADQLARHADFLSLGTNDLTQYTLAMDRCHPGFAEKLDGLHPAVLRLIARTVEGATRHGKWVGICGALASDLEAIPLLVGLGVTELSVSAGVVAEVKARVRTLDYEACRKQTLVLMNLTSPKEIRARARALWPDT